jgi:hypothetical protein
MDESVGGNVEASAMTVEEFRSLALAIPNAFESAHMSHPDFRITGGRIFATLGSPDETYGMVKLPPEVQSVVIAAEPEVFTPAKGGWGRGGSTLVRLAAAKADSVREAMRVAADAAAPKAKPKKRASP